MNLKLNVYFVFYGEFSDLISKRNDALLVSNALLMSLTFVHSKSLNSHGTFLRIK